MKESEVELYFRWVVEMNGGRTWKTKAIGEDGFPDRIAVFMGETWFVELKTKGGRLSPAQKDIADFLLLLGQKYACLWTKEQVDAWFSDRNKN